MNIGYTCNCAQCSETLEPDYPEECPETCASNHPVYGTDGTLWGQLRGWLFGAYIIDPSPECDCPTADEIAEDRAEARADAREDR